MWCYFSGSYGVVWFVLWMILTADTPESHPRISKIERQYIQESLRGQTNNTVDANVSMTYKKMR